MKTICIIGARGGSKRLYRKNVKFFCGKPLVEWSIIQARASHLFVGIWLTTDDDEIAEIGRRHGINIIRRPDWDDPDLLAINIAVIHALEEIEKQGIDYDSMIITIPTQVCKQPDDLDKLILRYAELKRRYDIHAVHSVYFPRETVIYEKLNSDKTKCVVFSKDFKYGTQSSGGGLNEKDWYKKIASKLIYDSEIDDYAIEDIPDAAPELRGEEIFYIPAKWYQQFDIDDLDGFELCEILFERYILKGRDEKVYWDYKKGQGDAIRAALEEIEK